MVHCVQGKVYSAQCTLGGEQCTVNSAQCTLESAQYRHRHSCNYPQSTESHLSFQTHTPFPRKLFVCVLREVVFIYSFSYCSIIIIIKYQKTKKACSIFFFCVIFVCDCNIVLYHYFSTFLPFNFFFFIFLTLLLFFFSTFFIPTFLLFYFSTFFNCVLKKIILQNKTKKRF